ncbi:MAG: [FeFe] hydrogenase H-cluster maturation GTPase HydF [Vampirovibrionales bacterium]|nr:[FeFe] hydrogenase H-cluster maturation GTPase HydF [Vampirovibrionales bacterium]
MNKTPKSLRLHIGLFGRTNVGKSSLLNAVADQQAAITSPVAGTTTDVVEKSMELLPIGPVTFLDTAGLDDRSALAPARIERAYRAMGRADVIVLVCEPDVWSDCETAIAQEARAKGLPLIVAFNKTDKAAVDPDVQASAQGVATAILYGSAISSDPQAQERLKKDFKQALAAHLPESFFAPPALAGDLLPPGGLAVLVVPIDLQAPKGRLILPQVQTIRDLLDNDAAALVVKEREYPALLQRLNAPPDLVICDSQVVARVVADTPPQTSLTTFSILFSRLKGDLQTMARGAARIEQLRPGDRVLIAEACTHHALEDDIGRVKIPRWLRQYTGCALEIDTYAGRDYPENLGDYRLVIHCGGCMINRREMLSRMGVTDEHALPITNYGVAISALQGVLRRALSPFPLAYAAYDEALKMPQESV